MAAPMWCSDPLSALGYTGFSRHLFPWETCMELVDTLKLRQSHLAAVRRDIHAHPELAFEEHRTAELVASRLEALGLETHRGIGRTGVVGALRAGASNRAIGLRADMDALPITERNDFPHHSRNPGRMHPAATTAIPPCCWARPSGW